MADAHALPGAAAGRAVRVETLLVLCAFAAFGFVFGAWQVLLVDLKSSLQMSDARFGAAVAAGFVGAYPAMYLGGRLADRWGAARLIALGAGLAALAFASLAAATDFALLVLSLLGFLGAAGAYDVGINAAGMHVEQRSGRRAMPYLHAAYSGGAALGALGAGVLLHLGMPFRALFVIAALLPAAVALAVHRQRALLAGAHVPQRAQQPGRVGPQRSGVPPRPFRSPAIWLLALITGLCFFGEGSVETWSALYLRDRFGAAVLLSAAGPAVFHIAMFSGRMISAAVVGRWGSHAVLRGAGVLAAAGMALALATNVPAWTLAGFLCTGLALAAIAPQAFSIAGDRAGGRGGEASSLITMVSYSGFLLGPALIGGLSAAFGLRIALASLIVAGLAIAVMALWLRPPVHAAAPGDSQAGGRDG